MGADGIRRSAAPWLGIAAVVFAAAAIGLTAFLGGGAESAATAPPREAPAAAKPNDRPRFEPSERLAAEAASPSPAPSGHAAPALPIVGITLTAIVRAESAPESLPNDPKILEAQGKTASLTVVLTRSAPRGAKDVEAVFIAGLNDGTKAKLSGGQFRFAALYPGRGIVRIMWTIFGSQQLNREIVLKPGSNTLEVDTERTINIRGKINDTEGSGEVVEPSIEIDGIPMKSPRAGYLTSAQVYSGRLMFDLTAKGYERRREWRTLLPMGRSRNVTSDFELGRGGTVIVRYSGLREDAPTPIAVLLPVGATDADRYPFGKLGFVRCDRSRREAVFEECRRKSGSRRACWPTRPFRSRS